MADIETTKRGIKAIFEEAMQAEKKLIFKGPELIRSDSRHHIDEIGSDHVVFKLLGEEHLIVPFAGVTHLRTDPKSLTVGFL